MTQDELKRRTRMFALRMINLVNNLPNTRAASAIGDQLVLSGTSVGASYRAVCRSKPTADSKNELAINESAYWLEPRAEAELVPKERRVALQSEAEEITKIVASASKTAKERRNPKSEFRNPK
jgi:four helix bundle protein